MKDYKNNYSIVPVTSRNFGRKFYQVRYNPRGHYFDKEFNNEKEAKKFINELVEMNNEEEKQINLNT